MAERDELWAMLEKAYAEGYRSGYLNGCEDQRTGETEEPSCGPHEYGDGFSCWMQGDDGTVPFPEVVSPGPLFAAEHKTYQTQPPLTEDDERWLAAMVEKHGLDGGDDAGR